MQKVRGAVEIFELDWYDTHKHHFYFMNVTPNCQNEDDNSRVTREAMYSGLEALLASFFVCSIGGPVGAVLGSVASSWLVPTVKEFLQRKLGERERQRVGTVFNCVSQKIQENLRSRQVRIDNFFEGAVTDRSPAEEICEAVLVAAQKDPEEKKLKYYGNLLGNISFDESIDRVQANHLIKTARDLSWSELCILFVVGQGKASMLKAESFANEEKIPSQIQHTFLSQIQKMWGEGVVSMGNDLLTNPEQIIPNLMKLSSTGKSLYNLMELDKISSDDDGLPQEVIQNLSP